MTPEEMLAEHVVDIRRIAADFRDAFERIQTSSTRASGVNKFFTSQSPLQRRLSVYNWNPGPRRGTEDAIEKQIAGKWHLITLQEASDYVDHAILRCAVLFNKDTFYPNVDVKSIYLHDTRRILPDHFVEGEHGWVSQGIVSRASFRRAAYPVAKQPSPSYHYTSTMSLPRKKGIAKKIIQTLRAIMISQDVDLVAGDFNGTAWRCRSRDNISTIDEVFFDCALPTPPGPTPLWGRRTIGRMCVVF